MSTQEKHIYAAALVTEIIIELCNAPDITQEQIVFFKELHRKFGKKIAYECGVFLNDNDNLST